MAGARWAKVATADPADVTPRDSRHRRVRFGEKNVLSSRDRPAL